MTDKSIFSQLTSIDVNDHIDKKETGKDRFGRAITLSYLSWAWAWDYFKKACPDAKYEIRHWDNRPYLYDENLGYMVETSITANGETHTMWLPVMDGTNSAMKATQQTFAMKRKDGTTYNKVVAPATMFDINKTIMRCLVKNMAMFGLGLYIYAGEDLPSDNEEPQTITQSPYAPTHQNPVRDIHPDDWMTINAFAGELARAESVAAIQTLVNGQRGNPHLNEMLTMAGKRKAEIIDQLSEQQGE